VPENSAASADDPPPTASSPVCTGPSHSPSKLLLSLPAESQAATGLVPSEDCSGESRGGAGVAPDSLQQQQGDDQERQGRKGGLAGKEGGIGEDSAGWVTAVGAGDASAGSDSRGADGQQARGLPGSSSSAMEISSPCRDGAGGNGCVVVRDGSSEPGATEKSRSPSKQGHRHSPEGSRVLEGAVSTPQIPAESVPSRGSSGLASVRTGKDGNLEPHSSRGPGNQSAGDGEGCNPPDGSARGCGDSGKHDFDGNGSDAGKASKLPLGFREGGAAASAAFDRPPKASDSGVGGEHSSSPRRSSSSCSGGLLETVVPRQQPEDGAFSPSSPSPSPRSKGGEKPRQSGAASRGARETTKSRDKAIGAGNGNS
ncbi:unnamed protein product, partial [Laminaria digitata]